MGRIVSPEMDGFFRQYLNAMKNPVKVQYAKSYWRFILDEDITDMTRSPSVPRA